MPQVPLYQQTESLRPAFQQKVTLQSTPDTFGASIGRGLQSVAAGLGSAADSLARVEELKATFEAKDSLTAFEREKMELDYGPNGYLTTQGRNAVDGRDQYNKALEELKKKHSPKVGAAAQKYNDAATAVVTNGMGEAIKHSAQGVKDFAATSSTARLSLYQDQALNGYDKPDQIKKSLGLGFAEIDEQARLMGWGPDVVELKRQEFSSQMHTNVALAMASKPSGAKSALNYIKENSDGIDPKVRMEMETTIKPFADDEEALGVVNEIISGGRKVKDLPGDIVAEVAGIDEVPGGEKPGVTRGGPSVAKAFLSKRSSHSYRPLDTLGLDDSFAENLAAMIQDAPPGIRDGLGMFSGFRTGEEQARAHANARPGMAAKRGGSQHEVGRAVDLSYNGQSLARAPKEVVDWVHRNASAYGLYFPLMNSQREMFGMAPIAPDRQENWHVEPIGTRGTVPLRGSTVVPARDGVSVRSSMTSMDDAMERINAIEDPAVRASAMKQFNAQLETRGKLENARSEEAKTQIFTMIMQGDTLANIPLDLKIAAGREAVSGFMDFEAKAGKVETDPMLYSRLTEAAATNPTEFAQIDMTSPEVINGLSREDWKSLSNKKTEILGDTRKAVETGAVYQEAYKVAEEFYSSAGIVSGNTNAARGAENVRREMQFRDAMRLETQQFMEANKGKKPGYEDLRAIAAMLTLKAIASEKRTNSITSFFDSDGRDDVWNGQLFQRFDAPPETDIRIEGVYENIPADWISVITDTLLQQNGTPPTKQQIVAEWLKTAQEIVGTN